MTLANEIENYKANKNEFEETVITEWLNDLLFGIDFLHRNNTTHFNLKPEFVFKDLKIFNLNK